MEEITRWLQAQPNFWQIMFLIVAAQFVVLALITGDARKAMRRIMTELGFGPRRNRRKRGGR